MKKSSKVKGVLEVLLVIGLILIIPLFFAIKTAADKQAAQNTPLPLTPTAIATLVNNATSAKQPPACTFPLAQTTTEESVPEEYSFSEPQVVLTAVQDNSYNIVDWLPDNQRVLITRDFRDNNQQNIELFNPQTGTVQVYAKRNRIDQPPAWAIGLNAVIYPDTKVLKITENNGMNRPSVEFRRQLWISRGDPQNVQLIEDTLLTGNFLSYFSVGIKPGGGQIVYHTHDDKKLSKRNKSLEVQQSISLDISQWEYRVRGSGLPISYSMAWRPNSSQIFLYTLGEAGGYTFLSDTDTGQICEIDLGRTGNEYGWADMARWSPDGKYLAIIRTWGSRPVDTSDLAILDTMTGKLYVMKIIPPDMEGLHFVNDVAWAPDSYHLTVIAQVLVQDPTLHTFNKISNLYLVDFLSNQAIQISSLSNEKLGSGLGSTNLIWSSNGSQLLVKCPTGQVDRLCLLSVQKTAHK